MSSAFDTLGTLADKISTHGEHSLTSSELQYFALTWFAIEIQSGGLNTFFSNDAGNYAHEALEGLRQVGASKTASVLERAISIFPGGCVPKDRLERNHLLDSLPDEVQWDFLSELSREYYASGEIVADLYQQYFATHRHEYPTLKNA